MISKKIHSLLSARHLPYRVGLPRLVLAMAALLTRPAAAICIALPEGGTWYNPAAFASPSRIVVQQTDCERSPPSDFLVVLVDAFGNVTDQLAGDYTRTKEGLKWLRVEPFSDGEYTEHVWILTRGASAVRVWIEYESPDGSGDFITDDIFSDTAPPSDASCTSCHDGAGTLPTLDHDALLLQALNGDVDLAGTLFLDPDQAFTTDPATPCSEAASSNLACLSEATATLLVPPVGPAMP
jgi:hypothetical protein